ncbi:MAG: hypothetical protein IJI45_04995, partial [Anaerolineaceae bacterium]|nr:hypothetical protein [Anaerolineaceae bacterium]
MKFRTDFVTNSSSASYTLVLEIAAADGAKAKASFDVSEEGDATIDGYKAGYDIYLEGNLENVGKMVQEKKDIDEIIISLCSQIKIEGALCDDDDWEDEEDDEEMLQSISELKNKLSGDGAGYPRTILKFKKDIQDAGITTDTIRFITARSEKFGSGDSAMWIEMDIFDPYRNRYSAATTEDERNAVIEEAAKYILTEPKWKIKDNESCAEESLPIVWTGSSESLRKSIRDALEEKANHRNGCYWMGASTFVDTYDAELKKEAARPVFLVNGN